MIISFNGAAGSGKSTAAKKLAQELGWPRYYIGGLRRQKAKEKGMTLAEYNQLGENDPATDIEVDQYQEQLARTEDNFIIEGRTSWHFIPQSLKIYLDVDEEIGAQRIFADLQANPDRNEDKNLQSVEDVLASNRRRRRSDNLRYRKYYGIDIHERGNYDLVIDSSQLSPDEVFAKISNFIAEKIKKAQS